MVLKRLTIALALTGLMLTSAPLMAQGTFNGGGGPFIIGALLDLGELQESFNNALNIKGDFNFGEEQYFLMYGGAGFGGSNWRLGGMGSTGEWTFPVNSDELAFDRVMLSLTLQGFMFDNVVAEMPGGGFSIGGVIGFGDLELQMIQDFQGSFQDFVNNPPLKFSMSRSFWYAQPFAAVELKLLDFMGIRFSAGYNVGVSFGEWELSDGQSVPDGPMKSLAFPTLQLMVVFGG